MNKRVGMLAIGLACVAAVAGADVRVFSIADFGARPGDCLETKHIQAAIDAASAAGGGEVQVPEGVFRVAGLRLKSGVTLRLADGAVLEGSRDPKDYIQPGSFRSWYNAIIVAEGASNVGIVGGRYATIDGRNCFDPKGEECYRGPHAIRFTGCTNVTFAGYSVRDSANWAHAVFHCANVTVRDLRIWGGHDGLDVHCCTNVTVSNCDFHTGDDGIAGFGNVKVTVRDCLFDCSCSCVRFGGTDCLFERCRSIQPASFGHRWGLTDEEKRLGVNRGDGLRHEGPMFTYYCDYRWGEVPRPEKIVFRECRFEKPYQLFGISFNGRNQWCCNRPLASIAFENCEVLGVRKLAGIYGGAEDPITFTMRNCRVTPAVGTETWPLVSAYNFRLLEFENVTLEGYVKPHLERRSMDGEVKVIGGTPLEVTFRADKRDEIRSFESLAAKVQDKAMDEAAFAEWMATNAPEGEAWRKIIDIWNGRLIGEEAKKAAWTFRQRYSYYFSGGRGQVRAAYAKGGYSDVPVGPFAYALSLVSPMMARVALTDFFLSGAHSPAAYAGVAAAIKRMHP